MNLSDIALYFYEYFVHYIEIGCYTFRRKHTCLIFQALTEYDYCGITKDSIVLDLGASVGGFTIHAAQRCKHIYAVEPLFTDLLIENLKLNNIQNCTVISYAIGERKKEEMVSFRDRKTVVNFCSFADILSMIPEKVDFMKCDIEGAEKYVDFDMIPNIEAEIHDEKGVYLYHKRNGFVLNGK
jgi:FkbM family methyltransferase